MKKLAILAALLLTSALSPGDSTAQPVITDSRIKTLVYNANDVYALLTHHGYQAHIEFGEKEVIRTISAGDRISWQIIPDGRRLFLRSLVAGAHTNLTVITNERSYQFDIRATKGGPIPVREELVYLVRFYYPDEHISQGKPPLPPVYAGDFVKGVQATGQASASLPALNFNYTYSGDDMLAPTKMFDDGKATYFKLRQPAAIYAVNSAGQEVSVPTTMTSDGFVKAPLISQRFILRYQAGDISIYNEAIGGVR